jgi:hypothetical protein
MESMIEGNQKELICKTGLIDEIVDWGITTDYEDQMKCVKKGENICTPLLNTTAMSNVFNSRCIGKDKCLMDNFDQFLLKNQNDK